MNNLKEIDIREIDGFLIGNAENEKTATGCTAILCPSGAFAGVDVRGGGPATRETDLLNPVNMVQQIHCVMLSGGSAFGLAAGDGAMQYLSEKGYGFETGFGNVPIVCGASLFDLATGDGGTYPDKAMGYEACRAAFEKAPLMQGNFGAGTGATVGKYLGAERMMKSGLGIYAVKLGDIKCGAVVAVNCLGDVTDTETGKKIAGIMTADRTELASTCDIILEEIAAGRNVFTGNTTIGCILTNVKLTKSECCKLASVTHNAYARAISPVHTSADGDTIFVMTTAEIEAAPDSLGVLAVKVMEKAIVRAVMSAKSAYGIKAAADLGK